MRAPGFSLHGDGVDQLRVWGCFAVGPVMRSKVPERSTGPGVRQVLRALVESVLVDGASDTQADPVLTRQPALSTPGQLRELRIAAGPEGLAGVLRVCKLHQIALIEQPQLQRLALHQGADLSALERGNPASLP